MSDEMNDHAVTDWLLAFGLLFTILCWLVAVIAIGVYAINHESWLGLLATVVLVCGGGATYIATSGVMRR